MVAWRAEVASCGSSMRLTLWTLAGFLSGLLIGILSPFAALAYVAWYDGTKWPTLGLAEILVFSVAGLEGAVNGAIGTMDGLRSRLRRLWPIAAVPALLPIVPLLVFQGDGKSQGAGILLGAIYGLFALIAGRVGQEIGIIGSNGARRASARSASSLEQPCE